ncbi:MAG TPA: CHAT domain-containing protein [Vicinamibacterales bacterium]|nr:CHAT domain-containing protein [Vicinamibacterales bacterium]
MVYHDFDLLIDRSGESLRAQVLNSPAGQASAEFRLPFSEDKLENYLLRLGRARRATRRVESQEMNTAKAFGAALFDAVFSADVKACFRSSIDEVRRQNAGLRIRLRLGDPTVADLPWEFLYNRSVNRFIALSVHTPLVRYMDLPERIQPIAVKPPIRVLVMISSPSDFPALDVEAEWTRLNEALKGRIDGGQLAIDRLEAASLEALQRRLRRDRYHIFHFIGHGEFDQDLQEGVLVLEAANKRGHKVDSQFLGMLLHDHESLRVAILNACEGARTSRTDPFAGSAQSLVQQGIPAVIAMQFEIADDVASRFAHEFYGALADGYPIDASLTEARKSIFAAGREVEWGTPVLYLRAPDGRIFDIENTAPPLRGPLDSGPKVIESAAHDQDRLADAIVAAATEAFAGGQRAEAIEMLRRYDPTRGTIGEALRKLTAEHQRLIEESQAAREVAREQEERARRAQDARAREIERSNALTQSRKAIEHSMASGDLDNAERELQRADESYDPGAEFADLRAHVLELRRDGELCQDRLADEVIEQARREFTKTPAGAVELLERFSPPHPRVTAAARELRELIAEQNEQVIRQAERRGEEERERQRNKEQRRREMQQAVERIRGYLDREELTEAAAALEAAEGTFGPASVFQELRARVKVAQRRLQHDDAARSAIGHGRNLAAAGDFRAALNLLEAFRPSHPDVEAVVEDLRRQQTETTSRLRAIGRTVTLPRVLWAAAAVFLLAAAALWFVPRWIGPRAGSPAVPGPASRVEVTKPAGPPATTTVSLPAPQPTGPAAVAPEAPPARREAQAESADPTPAPPAPTTGTGTVKPGVPDEKIVADHRRRIQGELAKKDPEQALARLSDALAYAPRDQGLRAIGPRVVDQAKGRASQERSKAVARGASRLAKFRQGDRAAQRARALSVKGDSIGSSRAYLEAANFFAGAGVESSKRRDGDASSRANDEDPAPAPEPVTEPATPPAPATAKSEPPAARPKPSATLLADPFVDAYAAALTRGDRGALLAVFPGAPADVLGRLSKRGPGYNLRTQIERQVTESDRRILVSCVFIHEVTSSAGTREIGRERHSLEFERNGDSLTLIKDQIR